ncbi:hypothetical protein EG827_05540 [bacterium]|nr:hypothetical protein [bacterium]
MDFIKALSIIGRDLDEAMAMLDQLSAAQGSDNAEIELARSRVRTASEMLRLLPGLNGANAPRPAQEVKHEPVVTATAETGTHQAIHVEQVKPADKAEQAIQVEQVKQAKQPKQAKHTDQAAEPHKPEDPKKSQEQAKVILADRFQQAGTIGEKISSTKADESIKSVMHSKPISDIAEAIGMNDKFYFIRELFSGNTTVYNETIGRLNASSSLGEAMKILDESTVMGSDPAAQSSFVDVVRRKFNLNV